MEDEHSSPLEGVSALISLLRHTNVIDHINLLLTSYYPHSFVRSSCNIQRQLNAEIPAGFVLLFDINLLMLIFQILKVLLSFRRQIQLPW